MKNPQDLILQPGEAEKISKTAHIPAVYINWLAKEKGIQSQNLDIPIHLDAKYQAEKFDEESSFVFFCTRTLNTHPAVHDYEALNHMGFWRRLKFFL